MYKFTVKTTSALFMHGANKEAELRPPSIKGVMRYWYRAIAGAYFEPDELRKKEAEIFGTTDTGSKLTVRIVENNSIRFESRDLLPHKAERNRRSPSQSIIAGNTFDITLQSYPPGSPEPDAAAWALWVALNLGGFGQRARRGAGSLQLVSVAPVIQGMPNTPPKFPEITAIRECLQTGLDAAIKVISKGGQVRNLREFEDFPILDYECARVYVRKLEAKSEEEARRKLMEQLRPYKNPIFGLPYMIPATGEERRNGRFASPLHLHLVPLQEGMALIQTVLFNGEFEKNKNKLINYLEEKGHKFIEVEL
ncbi:type III-B CRISPR module RAMP protein Cmr1 [Candidatus Chlorohelix sp.]|uniref:type III-B CRISPR module RAMP protein Cmr1 n=1 Tax=Candidatus Chlorohelix sp. TaxID=3139201 RepID=UPI00306398C2